MAQATNLLLAYPAVLRDAATITADVTYQARSPLKNIVTGGRSSTARVETPTYGPTVTVDMGSGQTRTLEYVVVAKASVVKGLGGTYFYVSQSNDLLGADTHVLGTTTDLQTRTYMGPRNEDLIFTAEVNNQFVQPIPTFAARYFKIRYGQTEAAATEPDEQPFFFEGTSFVGLRNRNAFNHGNTYFYEGAPGLELMVPSGPPPAPVAKSWEISKVYMGLFFDFGRDPLYPRSAGLAYFRGSLEKRPHYTFSLEWRDVRADKVREFEWAIARYKDISPVFLYTRYNHATLNGHRLVHCWIRDYQNEITAPDSYRVRMTFEELL